MSSEKDPVKKMLEASGFEKLNPPQEKALDKGLLKGENMVVAAPTASGKTGIAEIAALDTIRKNRKVVYIVPLRALASEKYKEFKEKYEDLGIKVSMSIGDYDSPDTWLGRADWIIVTSEKLDSLLRHGIDWLEDIGLVVTDEIHLLDSLERGSTLEVVLTRLRQKTNAKHLALSATIKNFEELAGWLDAKAVKSDHRPVKIFKGVCYDGEVNFVPQRKLKLTGEVRPLFELIDITLKKKKQALVFVSTRKSAEASAERLGKYINKRLKKKEKEELERVSDKVLHALGSPTKQCKRLAKCVKRGTAFHHAGETNKQRGILEEAFRNGTIKVLTATPTLAFGVNIPAHIVVIRDLKRFSPPGGMSFLPILEIHQMLGRCGRPKYDKEGYGILLPNDDSEADYAWENYIKGEPEDIKSKLGLEPALRVHTLALIASGVTPTRKKMMDFFSRTFYAHHYGDPERLSGRIDDKIQLLERIGLIEPEKNKKQKNQFVRAVDLKQKDRNLKPTRLGKRVAELYIDPLTADHLVHSLKAFENREINDFGLLHIISQCQEMKPLPSVRTKEWNDISDRVIEEEKNILEIPREWESEYEEFLKTVKNASVLQSWIDEEGEDKILDKYYITPGELRVRLSNADWLMYAAQEIALLLECKKIIKKIRKLRVRLKHGVKEELLPLVKLKEIGRARARKLWKSKLKTRADLRKVPLESLEKILGPKTARKVKDQLGEL